MARTLCRAVVAVFMVVMGTSLLAQEQVPAPDVVYRIPKMSCKGEGGNGRCVAEDVGNLRVRWTLYTTPAYESEGKDFLFRCNAYPETSKHWVVVEMAVTDSEHDTQRLRMTVKLIGDKAVFNKWVGEN